MSKIIDELSTIPEWNALGAGLKKHFRTLDSDILDNLDQDEIKKMLDDSFTDESLDVVARLVMIKIHEEWLKEASDDWDYFIERLKNGQKFSDNANRKYYCPPSFSTNTFVS